MTQSLSKWMSTAIFVSILIAPAAMFGQTSSNEELLALIKRLEARIAELEARTGKAAEAPSPSKPTTEPAPEPSVAEMKKDVEELKKNQTESAPILDFFKQTQVTGYVDTYYGHNLNDPEDQSVGLRGVNVNSDSLQFSVAKLSFNKPTTGPNTLGYRLDLVFGPQADSFLVPYEPIQGSVSIQRNVLNGYLSYAVPVGKGLNVDVGKFTTFMGAEVFDTIDNWNYQQGALFSWAQPFYHTGLRATYTATDKVGLGFYLVNGWNNSQDNNKGKSLGFSLTLTPSSKFQLIQNYLGGPEKTATNQGWRHLYDGVVVATLNKNVGLKFNYDFGIDRNAFPGLAQQDAKWQGIASSIRFSTSDGKIAFAPRFEYLNDAQGFATATVPQSLKTLTLTNEYRIKPNFSTKLEYRYDFSNQNVFKKGRVGDPLVNDQHVFLIGFVYAFGFGKE
jgi:hypothetical protein